MADELTAWLYGSPVATLDQERGRPRLTYSQVALQRYAPGTPLLSLSLPVRAERFPQGIVRPFLDGLLPEGASRRIIARDLRLRESDTYAMIQAIGRDCAGAIVIQTTHDTAPPPTSTLSAERLTEDALSELVRNLRSAPLGVDGRVRISLAGVQEKLLLTKMPDGSWGRPVDGTPSTHILKPEIAAYPDTVANEAFTMRLAKHLGNEVARVETTEIGGRKVIVVERYDRVIGRDGSVERIHQEDFCQATGTKPDRKYEEDGGPPLTRIAAIVDSAAAPASMNQLLQAVTLNVLIGNGDAHAKNFSLLHEKPGVLRLAPLYDLMCTLHYGDDRLAMYIDTVQRTDRVTPTRIVSEAVKWGMTRGLARELVDEVLDRAPAALEAARDETPGLPDAILDVVEGQVTRLRKSGAEDR